MEENIYEHLSLLGCTSIIQKTMAFQVFMALVDVKLMHKVDIFYSDVLKTPYLTGKSSKHAKSDVFVPCSTGISIDMKRIEELQTLGDAQITLACCEGDSTVVFYTLTKNLINPTNEDCFVRQKSREERRNRLEAEIRKNKRTLLSRASE